MSIETLFTISLSSLDRFYFRFQWRSYIKQLSECAGSVYHKFLNTIWPINEVSDKKVESFHRTVSLSWCKHCLTGVIFNWISLWRCSKTVSESNSTVQLAEQKMLFKTDLKWRAQILRSSRYLYVYNVYLYFWTLRKIIKFKCSVFKIKRCIMWPKSW